MRVIALITVLLAGLFAAPTPAQCGWCSAVPCWGAATCGIGCLCLGAGPQGAGRCVSVNRQ